MKHRPKTWLTIVYMPETRIELLSMNDDELEQLKFVNSNSK